MNFANKNKIMKILFIAIAVICSSSFCVFSQNDIASKKRVYFSTGFVTPQFYGGSELMQSYKLRQNGESYYQNAMGNRSAVGSYSQNTGFTLGIGFYVPLPKVKNLSVGLIVNSGQTGSTPSESGAAEGYFFNFLNFGIGTQYYLFDQTNLYIKGEIGMGSVWTKNRFLNEEGKQDFLHHFGIGLETGGGIGYTLTPFKNKKVGINLEVNCQYYSTSVEVSGIGNDQWKFGALNLSTGVQF